MALNSIKIRVALIAIVPLLGLLGVSIFGLADRYKASQQMAHLERMTGLAGQASRAVHELQKERALSAAYLGSKGEKFRDELAQQRTTSDEAVATFRGLAEGLAADGGDLGKAINRTLDNLGKLNDVRQAVSTQKIALPESFQYYSGTVASLIDIVAELSTSSRMSQLSSWIISYRTFLLAKEVAGKERALGLSILNATEPRPDLWREHVTLVAEQNAYMHEFLVLARQEMRDIYNVATSKPAAQEALKARDVLLALPTTGDAQGLDATAWFARATARIDLLKEVEDSVAHDLATIAADIGQDAKGEFVWLIVVLSALLVTSMVLSGIIIRSIVNPVGALTRCTTRLAEGERVAAVPGTERTDEIGALARAVAVFSEHQQEIVRLRQEQLETEQRAERERRRHLVELADDLESKVRSVIEMVSDKAVHIIDNAEKMGGKIDHSTSRSLTVTEAAERTSSNVETVASAAEELFASVQEISRQVIQSTEIAQSAVRETEQTNAIVMSLNEAVHKIGEIVGLITQIANQTNLLALNATIEAARAGEAGKGFAVVASEVKALSTQTARATDEIAAQIATVQSATDEAVKAIGRTSRTIQDINEIATAIAGAVEEQGAATQEIARNVREVSEDAKTVQESIVDVSRSSASSYGSAIKVMWAAKDLREPARRLGEEVDSFVATIRQGSSAA